MQFNKAAATTVLALGLGLLTGCEAEQTEKDMIAEAQFCLDKASDSASAQACMSKIEGLTSTQAYSLKCAAGFIGAEITSPENLNDAFNSISGTSGATGMLAALSFPSVSAVNETVSNCNNSGRAGLKLMAAMAKSATTLASLAPLGSCGSSLTDCDASQITSSINDLLADLQSGNPTLEAAAKESVTAIASSIQTVYTSTCSAGTNVNTDICGQINTAVAASGFDIATATGDQLAAIGEELLNSWKQ